MSVLTIADDMSIYSYFVACWCRLTEGREEVGD